MQIQIISGILENNDFFSLFKYNKNDILSYLFKTGWIKYDLKRITQLMA